MPDRRAAPGFHAAGNDDRGLTRRQQAHGHRYRVYPGAALRIDRKGRTAFGQARGQCDHAGRIAACAQRIAEHDRVDRLRVDAGTRQQGAHNGRGDLVRMQCAKCTPVGSHSAARPRANQGSEVRHGKSLEVAPTRWSCRLCASAL